MKMNNKNKYQLSDFYKEVYNLLLDECPDEKYLKHISELTDFEFLYLQNYVGEHSKLESNTSIGIIEAVEHIVQTAIDNENIVEKHENDWIKLV
jgi:hypothetical protein